jgi:hypothetical protein
MQHLTLGSFSNFLDIVKENVGIELVYDECRATYVDFWTPQTQDACFALAQKIACHLPGQPSC